MIPVDSPTQAALAFERIKQEAAWVHRPAENELHFLMAEGRLIRVTLEPCEELGGDWGFLVNGTFVWMDNPFWLGDYRGDHEVGDVWFQERNDE